MKKLNIISYCLMFFSLILLCFSMIKTDIEILMVSECLFFISSSWIFLTNKILQVQK